MLKPILETQDQINDIIHNKIELNKPQHLTHSSTHSRRLMHELLLTIKNSNDQQDNKLEEALNNGFDINIVDQGGNNLLYFLSNINWPQTLDCLIQNGIDMYHLNNRGQASIFNIEKPHMFDVILKNNFDIFFKDNTGQDFDSIIQHQADYLKSLKSLKMTKKISNKISKINTYYNDNLKEIEILSQKIKQLKTESR